MAFKQVEQPIEHVHAVLATVDRDTEYRIPVRKTADGSPQTWNSRSAARVPAQLPEPDRPEQASFDGTCDMAALSVHRPRSDPILDLPRPDLRARDVHGLAVRVDRDGDRHVANFELVDRLHP